MPCFEAPRVVVCGDGILHAVASIACGLSSAVAVFVPVEVEEAESLAQALLVHRAASASCIVFASAPMRKLTSEMQSRCGSAAGGVPQLWSQLLAHAHKCAARHSWRRCEVPSAVVSATITSARKPRFFAGKRGTALRACC